MYSGCWLAGTIWHHTGPWPAGTCVALEGGGMASWHLRSAGGCPLPG